MVRFLLTTIVRDKRTSWLLTIHTLNVRISIWNTDVSGIEYTCTFTSRVSFCCCCCFLFVSLFFSSRGAREHAVVLMILYRRPPPLRTQANPVFWWLRIHMISWYDLRPQIHLWILPPKSSLSDYLKKKRWSSQILYWGGRLRGILDATPSLFLTSVKCHEW